MGDTAMMLRMRLLKGANALLYIGPLVGGMSGFGWGLVASFAAIFVVWLIVLRPEQWPSTGAEWRQPTAWLSALTIVLSQVFLVAILFAVGRGIGVVTGFLPVVDPQLPLAISFIAIPLCRLLWDADKAADRGIFLDDEARAAISPRMAAAAAEAIVPLLNLPDDAEDAQVAVQVNAVLSVPAADLRLHALAAALQQASRSHSALRRSLVLWASEPEIVAPQVVPKAMDLAFRIAEHDSDLLRLYVPRALALVAAFPDRAVDFPSPTRLRETAASELGSGPYSDLPGHLRADLREGLRALADAIEQALAGPTARAKRQQTDASKARQARPA